MRARIILSKTKKRGKTTADHRWEIQAKGVGAVDREKASQAVTAVEVVRKWRVIASLFGWGNEGRAHTHTHIHKQTS